MQTKGYSENLKVRKFLEPTYKQDNNIKNDLKKIGQKNVHFINMNLGKD